MIDKLLNLLKHKKLILSVVNSLLVGGVLSLTIVSYSYSWYVRQEQHDAADVHTGTTDSITMESYSYTTSSEGTEGWVTKSITSSSSANLTDSDGVPVDGIGMDEVHTPSSGSFDLKEMSFGTVDNLVSLKEDNYLYFCFTLDAENTGKNISFNEILDSSTPFSLYNSSNTELTSSDTVFTSLGTIVEDSQILDFAYSLSSTKVSVSTDALEALEYTSFTLDSENVNKASFTASYDGNGTYYLYIRITPHLSSFSEVAKCVTTVMPCVLLWNCKMDIEIY